MGPWGLRGGVPPHRLHDCLRTLWETLILGVLYRITAGMSLPRKGCLRISAIGGVYGSSEVLSRLITYRYE